MVWQNGYATPHTITFMPPGPPPAGFDPFKPVQPAPFFDENFLYNGIISAIPQFGGQRRFALSFPREGTYSYVCILHVDQGMAGSIVVGPPGSAARGTGTSTGATISPPSTGDAGLQDTRSAIWMMHAGTAVLAASMAAAAIVLARLES